MFGLGGWEWALIFLAILLLFGPKQLPKLMKSFGKSAKALRDGLEGKTEEEEDAEAEEPAAKPKKKAKPAEDDLEDEEA